MWNPPPSVNHSSIYGHVYGWEIIRLPDFWLLIVPFVIGCSIDKVILFNTGTYLRSFKAEHHLHTLVAVACLVSDNLQNHCGTYVRSVHWEDTQSDVRGGYHTLKCSYVLYVSSICGQYCFIVHYHLLLVYFSRSTICNGSSTHCRVLWSPAFCN